MPVRPCRLRHDFVRRLLHRATVERRPRVILDHELTRFGCNVVVEQLGEPQCHVDPTRHASSGDDALVDMFDHPVWHRRGAVLGQRVIGRPMSRRGESIKQARRRKHMRSSADRGCEGRGLVSSAQPAQHSLVGLEGTSADTAGEDDDVGGRHVLEGGIDVDRQHGIVGANRANFVADERDVDIGNALQYLVGSNPVERRELVKQWNDHLQTHGPTLRPTQADAKFDPLA